MERTIDTAGVGHALCVFGAEILLNLRDSAILHVDHQISHLEYSLTIRNHYHCAIPLLRSEDAFRHDPFEGARV